MDSPLLRVRLVGHPISVLLRFLTCILAGLWSLKKSHQKLAARREKGGRQGTGGQPRASQSKEETRERRRKKETRERKDKRNKRKKRKKGKGKRSMLDFSRSEREGERERERCV